MRKLYTLLLILLGVTFAIDANASHLAGADLTFECVGQDSFLITLSVYRDCSGINLNGSTRTVDISSSCFSDFSATLQLQNVGGTEISQLCPDSIGLSQCVNSSNPYPGMQEYIFSAIVAFPGQCADFLVSFDENARNSVLNAQVSPATTQFYIDSELNTFLYPCNNSPIFTNQPIPYVCNNQNVNYNFGVVETDGDSLVYALVAARTFSTGTNVVPLTYNPGYSGAAPIPGITIDSSTGELNFTPTTAGKYIVAVEISEYNGAGQLVSTVQRDIQFVVINCSNQVPSNPPGMSNFSGTADSIAPTIIEAEIGESFCFDVSFSDANPSNVITLESNVQTALPGATFSVSGTNPAVATVCWTAIAGTNTNNVFNIVANDSACPVSGQNSIAFNVIVNQPNSVTATLTTTSISCNGVCDGTATVSISGGVGPYNVIWAPGSFSNTTTVTGLCPNAYNVIVQDLGDPDPSTNTWDSTFIISPAVPITTFLAGSVTHDDCDPGSCTGAVTVLATGGTGTLQYTWSDAGTGTTRTNLCAGNYTVTVTDDNNCTATRSIRIIEPSAVTATIASIIDVSCNGGSDGAITVDPSVACGYSINGCSSPTQTQVGTGSSTNASNVYPAPYGDFNNSAKHQMLFTASELNALGINEGRISALAFYVSLINGTQVYDDFTIRIGCTSLSSLTTASGFQTGLTTVFDSKDISISNGWNTHVFDHSYMWDGTSNVIVEWCFTNDLTAGGSSANSSSPYTTTSFSSVIYIHDNLTEACGLSTVTGASSNRPNVRFRHCDISYSYAWSPAPALGQTTPTVTGLTAGNYFVTVTGPDGCTDTVQATVNEPNPVVATITLDQGISCNGECDAEITASATGGDGNFTYTWSTLPAGANQTGLCPGTYEVIATDGNGCADTATITITEPNVLVASVTEVSAVSCNGVCDAELLASATGGTAPYTFTWNSLPSGANPTGVCAGVYEVYVSDVNGCSDTATITITEPTPLVLTLNQTAQILCYGDCSATVSASASGGTAPYTYSWPGGLTGVVQNNLCAGTYDVTVTDDNNCEDIQQIVITEPTELDGGLVVTTPVSCFGVCDAEASASITGGVAPYSITWPSGNTGLTESNLCGGDIVVTITDANSCQITDTLNIPEPPQILISITLDQSVSCSGDCNAAITASATGGTGNFTYTWNTLPNGATQTGLCAGTYIVTATDGTGCSASDTIDIVDPAPVQVTAAIDIAISCGGTCDAQATAVATGGTGVYTYTWSSPTLGTQNGGTQSGLCADTYQIIATDTNGCSDTTTLTITEPNPVTASLTQTQQILCAGDCTAELTVVPGGGTAPYTIAWPSGNSGLTEGNLCAGTYIVTVTDNNNCSATDTFTIVEPTPVVGNAILNNNASCFGACDGSATIGVSGGTPGYTVTWPSGATGATQNNLCAGNYDVTITDANGCSDTVALVITEPTEIVIGLTITSPISCNGICDGEIVASVSGGVAPYTLNWSNGQTGVDTISGLCADTFIVDVVDASGCTASDTIVLSEPTPLTVLIGVVDSVSCNNTCDAVLAAVVTGGTAPYNYAWSGGLSGDTLTGLCAGSYGVTVTDANSCQSTAVVTLINPAPFVASIQSTDSVTCFGGNDGSATVDVGGGGTSLVCGPNAVGCTGTTTAISVGTGGATNGILDFPSVYGASLGAARHQMIYTPSDLVAAGMTAGTITSISFNILDLRGVTNVQNFTISMGCTSNTSLSGAWLGGLTQVYSNSNVTLNTGTNTHVLTTPYLWDGTSSLIVDICLANAVGTVFNPELAVTTTAQPQCQYDAAFNNICANPTVPSTLTQRPDISFEYCAAPPSTGSSYSYAWSPAPAAGQASQTASNLTAGTYIVTVTDLATGCSDTAVAHIYEPTEIVGTITIDSAITCSGTCNGEITVTATGGIPGYSYLWSNGSTDSSLTGLCAGTYTVTITDANGCFDTVDVVLTEPNPVLANGTILAGISCGNACDGIISVMPSGGTAPYNVAWSSGQNGMDTLSGLCADTYIVTVTDSLGCFDIDTIQLSNPTPVTSTVTIDNTISCFNACDGQATVSASGGTAPYTITWPSGTVGGTDTNLCAGTYDVTISDNNGCSDTATVTLINPTELIASPSIVTPISCSGVCDAEVTATVTGGSGNYTYSWSNGDLGPTAQNVCAGTLVLIVVDNISGCSDTASIQVIEPAPISVSINIDSLVSCNGLCDGALSAAATGGTAPYTYVWNGSINGDSINGLCAGQYIVVATDSNGCTGTDTIDLTNPGTLSATASLVNGISCFGVCDAEAMVTVSGGNTPYTYAWPSGNTTPINTNLCAGAYDVTVTDSNGCSIIASINISSPTEIVITDSITNEITCPGSCDGQAVVSVVGGAGGYTYAWPSGQTGPSAGGFCAGDVIVTVTDQSGCFSTDTITFTDPTPIVISITEDSSIICNGQCNGQLTASATGGAGGYTFSWSNGVSDTTITGLCAGVYTVVVADSNGCSDTLAYTLVEPQAITPVITVVGATCGICDGVIEVDTVTGGTAPYTYAWGGVTPVPGNVDSIGGLCVGTYSLTVTDSLGCSTQMNIPLSNIGGPTASGILGVNVTCFDSCNGIASVTPQGGQAPFTYAWSTGNIADTTDTVINLCPGTYFVTITDAGNCALIDSVTITQPTAIQNNISVTNLLCNGICDGEIIVVTIGGTPAYTYAWSDGATDSVRTGLCAGQYVVTTTDGNGCSRIDTVTITEPTAVILAMNQTGVSCFGSCDGVASVAASGGNMPYSYLWNTGDTTDTIIGLCAGQYYVEVTDSNGCVVSDTIDVTSPTQIVIDSINTINPGCGANDGSIEVFVSGGSGNYTYSWDGGAFVGNPYTGLAAGAYALDITDDSGCTFSTIIPLSNQSTPVISTTSTDVACGGDCDGVVTVSAPVGNYQILWSTGNIADTTDTVNNLCAGIYIVSVTDPVSGCIAVDTAIINQPTPIVINNLLVQDPSCGLSDGSVEAFASGGTGSLIYVWNTSDTINPYAGLAPGVYDLTVIDSLGCFADTSLILDNSDSIVVTASSTPVSCFGNCDGMAEVLISTSTGSGPYGYQWSSATNDTNDTVSGLCVGIYFITVTDSITGCVAIDSTEVMAPLPITIDSVTITAPGCGATDGEIIAYASGGSGVLQYVWNTSDTINPLQNIGGGVYSLTVFDTNGCSVDLLVPVSETGAPDVDVATTDAGCNGECIGTATATVTGGSGVFGYSWTTGDTSITVDSLCAGSYGVQVFDSISGCMAADTASVIQPDSLEINFDVTDHYNCSVATICTGEIAPIPNGNGPYTYAWSNGTSDSVAISLCAGVYTVTVTGTGGCVAIDSAEVFETPLLSITDTVIDASCVNTNDGTIDITVGGGVGTYTYSWTGNGFTATTEDIGNLLAGQYIVTVTDTAGCFVTDTIDIGVETTLTLDANNRALCQFVDSVWLSAQATSNALITYQWLDLNGQFMGDSSSALVPAGDSLAYVVVANSNNCFAVDTAYITTDNIPDVDAGLYSTILAGEEVSIGGNPTTSLGGSTYEWSPFETLDDNMLANPIASPRQTTTYTVTVTNIYGCTNTDTVTVFVVTDIEVPTGFSPNGDGVNDVWELDVLEGYPTATVQVFNRWGQLVFESEGYQDPWAGKYNGKDLPVGTYYYVIDLGDDDVMSEPITGPVSIMR